MTTNDLLDESLEDLYETAPCGYVSTRPDGTIVKINGTLLAWTGYRREDLLAGKRFQDLLTVAGKIFYETHYAPLLQMQGFLNEIAFEIACADGTRLPVLVNAVQKHDDAGRAVFTRVSVFNATDRRRYEQELLRARRQAEQSEERYRFLAESNPHMVWTALADGQIDYMNARWADYTGLASDQALGWRWADLLHPNDRAMASAAWRIAVQDGASYSAEFRVRRGDGQHRWFLARAEPFRDEQGQIIRWFGTATDIEDAKRIERVLREREQLYRTLAEALPQLVWMTRGDGTPDYFNRRWREYTGVELLTEQANDWAGLVHPEDLDRVLQHWDRSLTTGAPYEIEYRLRGADGRYRWFLARATPVREGGGEIVRWFGTGTDITEIVRARETLTRSGEELQRLVAERTAQLEDSNRRLRAEMEERVQVQQALQRAQKLEAIGQLTGGVAHDFNNLLQVIAGNLQLLERNISNAQEAQRRLHAAMGAVERGAKLAAQLLAFARRQPLEPRVINLGRLVRAMDDLLRRALGEAIDIETIIAGGLWNTIVDPDQVENVILNLAVNARDAMEGVGKLTIEAGNAMLDDHYARQHADVTPGQYVMLAVTDTGCGMPPEVIERVFEPFFSTKPEGKGTGLGLSMVYGFVKQSAGHVKIYSEVGQGTTIRIYLPRVHQAEEVAPDLRRAPVQGGSETILVVEDDPAVQATVVDTLTDLGYRVLKANDAQSAITVINSGVPIDLVFTDVVMPGPLRSTDLARQAQAAIPGVVVLFTSGYTNNAIIHGGRLDPGVHLLSKPYSREDLARKVHHLLHNREVPAVPQLSLSGQQKPTDGSPSSYRILLVEDDALIQMTTLEMLEALGHTVTAVSDAEEAQRVLADGNFDVLFTDVSLPGRSGVELARQAVRQTPQLQVIIASGFGDDLAAEQTKAGLNAVALSKPYTLDGIERALSRLRRLP
ncbi:hybrid sensor histidine kinase/response regulator [Azospirillum canadense]|uniref:hybrid sensor histidine kinase/response regulator n=1 Tax=Azospirillum canadense TaxID=403962 RepID=UPI002227C829|nr:PAS domain S-box protein [Azospirillum canadense]MCW2241513.1 PAS domain S-box-containing protein [Azospirillum canadense]